MDAKDLYSQLGVGAIFVIVVLREIFSFLKKKNQIPDGNDRLEEAISRLSECAIRQEGLLSRLCQDHLETSRGVVRIESRLTVDRK